MLHDNASRKHQTIGILKFYERENKMVLETFLKLMIF